MKKIIALAFVLITSNIAAFAGEHRIAFERTDAVYVANLDGTAEKKIADGIFPAISLDGTQVAFNTVEKTSDTTYIRHIAVTDVATGARPRFSRMSRVTTAITRRGRQMESASYLRCVRMRFGTLASSTQMELTFAF